jgi:hypothetical protein
MFNPQTQALLTPKPELRATTIADLPPCCQDRANIVQYWPRADLRVTLCKVCNHKYTRLYAEPGSLGAMLHG